MKLFERRDATGAQTRSAYVTSDEYVLLFIRLFSCEALYRFRAESYMIYKRMCQKILHT